MDIENVPHVNSLLQKIKLPGRIFQLPSRGLFYQHGELSNSVNNGEIHVHPMSAIDEINMKSPDMLFSGKAIIEVCRTCIPEIQNPLQLLARDVDAVMLFLRVVTYGNTFEIEITHTCEHAKKQTYAVDIEKAINDMVYLDPTETDEKYSITMTNGQVVKIQPAKYQHVVELLQMNESKKDFTPVDIANNIFHNLLNLVHDVDGVTDRKDVEEWLRAAPTTFINKIAHGIELLNRWGPSTQTKIVCRDCGEEVTVEIPLNPIDFFSE